MILIDINHRVEENAEDQEKNDEEEGEEDALHPSILELRFSDCFEHMKSIKIRL